MRRFLKILVVLVILAQACSRTDSQFENILYSPGKFHGQKITITGTFHYEFEDVAIYLTRYSEKEKAFWLNFSEIPGLDKTLEGFNGETIKITGIFNTKDTGHLGQYAGSVDEVGIIKD